MCLAETHVFLPEMRPKESFPKGNRLRYHILSQELAHVALVRSQQSNYSMTFAHFHLFKKCHSMEKSRVYSTTVTSACYMGISILKSLEPKYLVKNEMTE